MDASTLMTTAVATVAPDTPVSELARIMIESRISAVPVLDHGRLVGIVSEGDLLHRIELGTGQKPSRWMELVFNRTLAAGYVKQHGRKASDVMTRGVITVSPGTRVIEIASILETHHIKRVPVVMNGALIGIVSRADLIRALANNAEAVRSARSPQDRDVLAALPRDAQPAMDLPAHRGECGR